MSENITNPSPEEENNSDYSIKVVQTLTEIMQVFSVRAAVFMSEQKCPYHEEFDGNDFCATHIVAYKDNEPIACIRCRFFADFAKIERLAVRHEFRNTSMSFSIVRAAIDLISKKGYSTIYGHAQVRLVNFWSRFGFRPRIERPKLRFSDFEYIEIIKELDPNPTAISLDSNPYVIIRPEGTWHEAGVLETSALRPITNPLINVQAA